MRKLQNNPHLSASENFPFNVYAPISVGSLVTAFSKKFRILQRGRVMAFDRSSAVYLIEFENSQIGYELCPDSDVATSGGPKLLIASSDKRTLSRTPLMHGAEGAMSTGSATGPLTGKLLTATTWQILIGSNGSKNK